MQLDTSVYNKVARPARWLETFARMGPQRQVHVMEQCFCSLSYDEKKVVVATFAGDWASRPVVLRLTSASILKKILRLRAIMFVRGFPLV